MLGAQVGRTMEHRGSYGKGIDHDHGVRGAHSLAPSRWVEIVPETAQPRGGVPGRPRRDRYGARARMVVAQPNAWRRPKSYLVVSMAQSKRANALSIEPARCIASRRNA